MREKISAFVISHNRASMLESCLRAVSFVDELIVVDKSSTDGSAGVASRYADRVEIVPWSPTVEETRAFALSLCRHDRILFLDDDEILSPEAESYFSQAVDWRNVDIHSIPYRHYILGVHDERAYYWPEVRHCLFRKGAIEFIPTVHGGTVLQSDRIGAIPIESGVAIHHLSHPGVASWIERANRYSGRPDRVRVLGGEGDLIRFSHDRITYWMERTGKTSSDDYPIAVALLRALYDMIDRLKDWEARRGLDGAAMFRVARDKLVPAIAGVERRAKHQAGSRGAEIREPDAGWSDRAEPSGLAAGLLDKPGDVLHMEPRGMLVQLRAAEAQARERTNAARRSAEALVCARDELVETHAALAGMRDDLTSCRTALAVTRSELAETRMALDQTRACFEIAKVDAERLSGSARLFVRQYLPKLWHHLSRHPAFNRLNPNRP